MNDEPMVWDATVKRLVAFAARARYEILSATTVHETRRHLIDTFASALGAFDEPVSVMSRAVAARYRSDDQARVWGSTSKFRTAIAPQRRRRNNAELQ